MVAIHVGALFVIARQLIVRTSQPVQAQQNILVVSLHHSPQSKTNSTPSPAPVPAAVKAQTHSAPRSRTIDKAALPRPLPPADETLFTDAPRVHTTAQNAGHTAESVAAQIFSAPLASGPKNVHRIECSMVHPAYPALSRQRGAQGTVQIRMIVDTHGRVEQAILQQSSGFKQLDQAALDAARNSLCRPYRENGVPIRASTDVPFKFSLED